MLKKEEQALFSGRTEHGRFGFAVLLKYFQYNGQYPDSCRKIPIDVKGYWAKQLRIPLNSLDRFKWQGRTAKHQQAEILSYLGIRRMNSGDWDALVLWLWSDLLAADPALDHYTAAVANVPQFEYLVMPIRRRKAFSNASGAGLAVAELSPRDPKACTELDLLFKSIFNIN